MPPNASGEPYRKHLTLPKIAAMFDTEDKARTRIESARWPDGPFCPHCGSFNVQRGIKHKSRTHRCRDCPNRPMFTVRVGTVMQGTHLKHLEWVIAVYLYTTSLKGISGMKLHREFGMTRKSAWFLPHRLLEAAKDRGEPFSGPIEADGTRLDGLRATMSDAKREELAGTGRRAVGKTTVVGTKDRETDMVDAKVVEATKAETLKGRLPEMANGDALVYRDDAAAHEGMGLRHGSVCHGAGEYARERARANGTVVPVTAKAGDIGIYHRMSPKRLKRHVDGSMHRRDIRKRDTIDRMERVGQGMDGRRVMYRRLEADNGLPDGARG